MNLQTNKQKKFKTPIHWFKQASKGNGIQETNLIEKKVVSYFNNDTYDNKREFTGNKQRENIFL